MARETGLTISVGRLEFGGPDLPARRLRDLLEAEIESVPAGGRIDWATYYFRDRALAAALSRAAARGAAVRVMIERSPRRRGANDRVAAMLASDPRVTFHSLSWWPGRLHAKAYCFSSPARAWIGSFNPSGDEPEDAEVLAEIGDQDRGDNLLVELTRPDLVTALRRMISALPKVQPLLARADPRWPAGAGDEETRLYIYPRWRSAPLERRIAALGRGARVDGALSHFKAGRLSRALQAAALRGADVRLLLHATERRVPPALVAELQQAGVQAWRVGDGKSAPMHAKMIRIAGAAGTECWTGSLNFNPRSRFLNAELLLRSRDPRLAQAVAARLSALQARAAALRG